MSKNLLATLPAALALNLTMSLSMILASGAAAADDLNNQGDAAAGKAKSAVCAACHGADGNSVNPEWPSLAGQHASYTVTQLKGFKGGDRANALMSSQAVGLSEQDMHDLAAHFAEQAATPGMADPALVRRGRTLYYAGDASKDISACAACHGPTGLGNGLAGIPSLRGQKDVYIANQLQAYASGARKSLGTTEGKNKMMGAIAANLSAEDKAAVANFISALRD